MGFSRSHNGELKSVERGRAGADTPMSNQDFDVPMSIQANPGDSKKINPTHFEAQIKNNINT